MELVVTRDGFGDSEQSTPLTAVRPDTTCNEDVDEVTGQVGPAPASEPEKFWVHLGQLLGAFGSFRVLTEFLHRFLEAEASIAGTASHSTSAPCSCTEAVRSAGQHASSQSCCMHGTGSRFRMSLRRYRNWLVPLTACDLENELDAISPEPAAARLGNTAPLYSAGQENPSAQISDVFIQKKARNRYLQWVRLRAWLQERLISCAHMRLPSFAPRWSEFSMENLPSFENIRKSLFLMNWRCMWSSLPESAVTVGTRRPADHRDSLIFTCWFSKKDTITEKSCRKKRLWSSRLLWRAQTTNDGFTRIHGATRSSRCSASESVPKSAELERDANTSERMCDGDPTPPQPASVAMHSSPQVQHEQEDARQLRWLYRLPWTQRKWIWCETDESTHPGAEGSRATGNNRNARSIEAWRVLDSLSLDLNRVSSWLTARRLSSTFEEWDADEEPPLDPSAPLIISAARSSTAEDDSPRFNLLHGVTETAADTQESIQADTQLDAANHHQGNSPGSLRSASAGQSRMRMEFTSDEHTVFQDDSSASGSRMPRHLREPIQRLTMNLHFLLDNPHLNVAPYERLANMGSSSFDDLSALDHAQRHLGNVENLRTHSGLDPETIERYTLVGSVTEEGIPVIGTLNPGPLDLEHSSTWNSNDDSGADNANQVTRMASDAARVSAPGECCCVVCLEPMRRAEIVRILPCCHFYHKDCVDRWLQRHKRCPVCNGDIEQLALAFSDPSAGCDSGTQGANGSARVAIRGGHAASRRDRLRRRYRAGDRAPSPALFFPNEDPLDLIEADGAWWDWFQGPAPHELE